MASGTITREIESRIKQSPEHFFEVFLEIHEPTHNEPPEILIKYPDDFSDHILKTAAIFAYPCQIPSDEQSEHFTFVVLDSTSSIFRFGYCRRSNRESTCLCLISYYPWFDIFYNILNDLSQIINSKSTSEVDTFLSALYNYPLMSTTEFHQNKGTESIDITLLSKVYTYSRPDQRQLPSMLSNRNFSVMFSRLGPDIMLQLFAHLLFERRVLFISSKLFHLTACACGCLHLINPMHWQSIFLPILPESMSWTAQCTAPFIIGVHSSVYSRMNRNELGDVVLVNIDDRTIQSPYDDLNSFPKYLVRRMKKDIQQSSQLIGDHLARVFLRTMTLIIGNYAGGFVEKNGELDFDRDLYLKQYQGSDEFNFMSSVANTQMFEQFSRYRALVQSEDEMSMDAFDIEVKNLEQIQQSKKTKSNKRIYKILEKQINNDSSRSPFADERNKATNPLIEQVQNQAEKLQSVINKAGQKVANEASLVKNNLATFDIKDVMKRKTDEPIQSNYLSVEQTNPTDLLNEKSSSSSRCSTPELKGNSLINFDTDENPLLPSPIVLNVIQTPALIPETPRSTPQIDSKIKQLQTELQYKVQTFDVKRPDPRNDYGTEQKEIKKLVQQFDPLDEISPVVFREDTQPLDRHPSINEVIPTNCVNSVLKNIQSNYGTSTRTNSKSISNSSTSDFDPLILPTKTVSPQPPSTDNTGSNLIDFN